MREKKKKGNSTVHHTTILFERTGDSTNKKVNEYDDCFSLKHTANISFINSNYNEDFCLQIQRIICQSKQKRELY